MNYKKIIPAALIAVSSVSFAQGVPESDSEKFSYAAGVYSVRGIKPLIDSEKDFDKSQYLMGIETALSGKDSIMTEEGMREVLMAAEQKRAEKHQQIQAMAAEENVAKGQAFRDEYAKGEDVKSTESGMLYKILAEGEGDSPVKENTVVVHYAGRLIDGTEFDSSVARGEPATFPLANVIPGWTEIVQLMKPGAKYEVVIPSELAYGDRGAGKLITPNATLIFDIELIDIQAEQTQ